MGPTIHAVRRAWAWSGPRLRLSVTAGLKAHEPCALALFAILTLSVYFLMFPNVDVAVSALFHDPARGFMLSRDPELRLLRSSSSLVLGALLVGVIGHLAWRAATRRPMAFAARRCGFALAALAAGPGLVVNTVLKQVWGRARPVDIDLFGGRDPFTPAWVVSDACRDNCSFVSGEAASAAWMVGAVLALAPAAWRPAVLPPVVLYAFALSMNRLAFGGHFLSDILLSWALTALTMAALHRVMVAAPGVAWARRRRAVATVA